MVERSNSLIYLQDLMIRIRKVKTWKKKKLNIMSPSEFKNEVKKEFIV